MEETTLAILNLYSSRDELMVKLRATLGEAFKVFEALDNIERASFVLGCELWTENFDSMLALVKEYLKGGTCPVSKNILLHICNFMNI